MDAITKRIELLINQSFEGNLSRFSREVDISYSTLCNIVGKRRTPPTRKVIYRILDKIPELSAKWLLEGIGDMFIPQKGESTLSDNKDSRIVEELNKLKEENLKLKDEIIRLQKIIIERNG